MKYIDWNELKNMQLKAERSLCFEDVQAVIEEGRVLEARFHHNPKRYPEQSIIVVNIRNYIYLVPYVEDAQKIFLKTIIPSRKATKQHLGKERGK